MRSTRIKCCRCRWLFQYHHQLFHTTLAKILEPLQSSMEKPDIVFCCDDHFCCAIYGLGPYIADYPEQCLLACIVQGWCLKLVQLDCSEFGITTHIVFVRCLAPAVDLDSERDSQGHKHLLRHKNHTNTLLEEWQLGCLWDFYGIVGDLIVSCHYPLFNQNFKLSLKAIFGTPSLCQHLWTYRTRHPTPTY